MATRAPSSSAQPSTPARPRLRGLVVLFALISLVAIFAMHVYALPTDKGGPFLSAPFWLPYLFVILRVRGKKPRSGLALAIAMSCAMIGPAAWLIVYARSWDANWRIQAGLAVIVVAQLALAGTAILSWRSWPPENGLWRTVIANGTYAAIAMFIFTSFLWRAPNRIAQDEDGAIWMLQTIEKAAASYAGQFGVYPAHLTALDGPPGDEKPTCQAASLLSLAVNPSEPDRFESRGWGGEYVLEYEAGAPAKGAAGCVGANSYQLRARPRIFRKTGRRSFLLDPPGLEQAGLDKTRLDQTRLNSRGTLRSTLEDRAARVTDPPATPPASPGP